MGWFKKRIKVGAEPLIEHRLQRAFMEEKDRLVQLLAASNHEPNALETSIYAAYQDVLAMNLAGLDDRVRYGYAEAAYQFMEQTSSGQGRVLQQRFAEYSVAFESDVSAGESHLAPKMITRVLGNLFGASDESVVLARLALVMSHKACIETRVPFFKDLKVVF